MTSRVEIKVGRFDRIQTVAVPEGSTLASALAEVGLELSPSEKVVDLDGDVIETTAIVESGKTYVVDENHKAGQ